MAQWQPPARDRIKVNLDGVPPMQILGKRDPVFAGAGRITYAGEPLAEAETHALLQDISVTERKGSRQPVFCTDCKYYSKPPQTTNYDAAHPEPASERSEVSASSSFNPVSDNLCGS
jgi:hypothetical protein